ncbi:hypothetical protein CTAYLR_000863 [Chrysophaeum taylorii]|uniref:Methyltransferase n=1 Tax=Chrysophaeum taylorii TaxID=2483200 RepID=A0AAD7UQ02_9STRA|nr:hypothetical protein CTAYLR_000863 [Chrysophaeum taylorii]
MDLVKERPVVAVFAGVVCAASSPSIVRGIKLTLTFLRSLTTSGKRQKRIDGYNEMHEADGADGRNDAYATLVDSYYDLATEFYEWGWGSCFHFADRRGGESFAQSLARHEYYLASRLDLAPGARVLDCGCGIGGPARNIARFTRATITGITLNQFQVDRANALSKREGVDHLVTVVQGDFMKLPFEDNSFDAVYGIEATCHAPDRIKCYSEIFRVLKPGATFACYEWCLTDAYDPANPDHRKLKKDIEVGDGLPDLVHTSVCTEALEKAGFRVLETRDCAKDGLLDGGEPWYTPLTPSWNPLKWPRFQFNPVMFFLMPKILRSFEFARLVPPGTAKTQVMLQAGGIGCAQGGITGAFTPMWLMVGKKPL